MVVRVTRGLTSNTVFGNSLATQINEVIAKEAQRVATEAVRRADAIVSAEFNTGRPESERRPGRHLLGSFTAVVRMDDTTGPYPVVISVRSSAPAAKVNALNRGSSAHTISPKNGKKLAFPDTRGLQKHRQGRSRAVVSGSVEAPSLRAHYFLERALEQAVAVVFHKTIRLPRR